MVASGDVPGTGHLLFTPRRKKLNEGLQLMEMWIDRKTHLPVKIISKDKNRYITTIVFRNIKTGLELKDNEFLLPIRKGWKSNTRRFKEGENIRP